MSYHLEGKKFNMLTVIEKDGHMGKKVLWKCICECGNYTHVSTNDLTSNNTKSCGCYNKDAIKNRSITHGLSKTQIYHSWTAMKDRCFNKNSNRYKDYGGRGITICDKWLSFEGFYEDMGDSFKPNLSIDRIDYNKNYELSNCKWSNCTEQANNKRNVKLYEYNGIKDSLNNICRELNLNRALVYNRIRKGWSIEKAIEKPKQNNQYEKNV